ncbi:hypothetical protein J6590_007652 [Homalodisca vitripennis]|nr:hypothetical protein J6590_007652 [Homalodisca vitripennis]
MRYPTRGGGPGQTSSPPSWSPSDLGKSQSLFTRTMRYTIPAGRTRADLLTTVLVTIGFRQEPIFLHSHNAIHDTRGGGPGQTSSPPSWSSSDLGKSQSFFTRTMRYTRYPRGRTRADLLTTVLVIIGFRQEPISLHSDNAIHTIPAGEDQVTIRFMQEPISLHSDNAIHTIPAGEDQVRPPLHRPGHHRIYAKANLSSLAQCDTPDTRGGGPGQTSSPPSWSPSDLGKSQSLFTRTMRYTRYRGGGPGQTSSPPSWSPSDLGKSQSLFTRTMRYTRYPRGWTRADLLTTVLVTIGFRQEPISLHSHNAIHTIPAGEDQGRPPHHRPGHHRI